MTMKIKSSHPESQGPFVVIDKENFNPDVHEEYVEGAEVAPADMNVAQIKAALAAKVIEIPDGAKKSELLELLTSAE